MQQLNKLVNEWAEARGINNPVAQTLKFVEEAGEAFTDGDWADCIGDQCVVLARLCTLLGLDPDQFVKEYDVDVRDSFTDEEFSLAYMVAMSELAGAVLKKKCPILAIDKLVININELANSKNISVTECYQLAYDTISSRSGVTTSDGSFIKSE